jgi:hypothetical protein
VTRAVSFTQTDCRRIARKLGARILTGRRAHDRVEVIHDGKLVAHFGIRRASREVGHGHLPGDLFITPRQCRLLAQCPLSRDDYFAILKEKGRVD